MMKAGYSKFKLNLLSGLKTNSGKYRVGEAPVLEDLVMAMVLAT
jgi:hypothetical protein